jgi:glycosyltransferase involved in cell wall biosynthesis
MAKILILAANIGIVVGGYGGAERSLKLAESMPEHDVTVLMSSMNGDNQSKVINPKLKMIHVVEDRNTAMQVFQYSKRECAGNLDIAIYQMYNRIIRYKAELKKQIQAADLIILDHVGAMGLVRGLDINIPVIYASHNCESDLADQMYPRHPLNKRTMFEMEKAIIELSDVITYCSKEDISKMKDLYNFDKPTYYIPNGTDEQELNRNNANSKDLVFIGSGHGPNVDAAKSLIDTARVLPEYRFNIIGKCGESIPKEGLPSNYIVHGFLSDQIMELLFSNSFAFLNPMTAGSGTHLKIMRALSHGLPIISSRTGLRGFTDDEINNTLFVAANNEEIVKSINVLKNEKEYERVSRATQELAKPYLWPVIQKQFDEVVNSVIKVKPTVHEVSETKEKESVLIYSIIRNNGATLDRYYDQIVATVSMLTDYNFYLSIYENDSTDNTAAKLMAKDWSFLSGVSIVSEKLGTQHYGSVKDAQRVENLAKARNKAIEGGGFLSKVDYILMTEGDNSFQPADVEKLLSFKSKEPNFDVVSAISIRDNGSHYDWWATRTGPNYKRGASEVPRNFNRLKYDQYYSTSNGLCLYRAKPFQEGARYGWTNLVTGEFDCEMVVVCQELRNRGYDKVFINYESKSYHH